MYYSLLCSHVIVLDIDCCWINPNRVVSCMLARLPRYLIALSGIVQLPMNIFDSLTWRANIMTHKLKSYDMHIL